MAGGGGIVQVPWYATGFRADGLEKALGEISAVSLRYGATSYDVYRFRDDRYRFIQFCAFQDKLDWERYWEGDEFVDWRVRHSSWYQVPVIYGWADLTAHGAVGPEPVMAGDTLGGDRAVGDAQA